MKKVSLLVLSVLILSSGTASAQDYRHEVSFSVGVGSVPAILEEFRDVAMFLIFPPLASLIREDSEMAVPTLSLSYRHHLRKWLSLGGTFAYEQMERTYYFRDQETGTTDISYYTLMGRIDFTYVRLRLYQMYSGAALGISFSTERAENDESQGENYFAFQVNAVGLRVGERVAGFLELGLGFNGIVCAGMTGTF
ncbi:MAG: hypothetical protein JSV33_06030 [bacterium]|nr:MAG: hypothetical protein JSV33_06030 [bacterium]